MNRNVILLTQFSQVYLPILTGTFSASVARVWLYRNLIITIITITNSGMHS